MTFRSEALWLVLLIGGLFFAPNSGFSQSSDQPFVLGGKKDKKSIAMCSSICAKAVTNELSDNEKVTLNQCKNAGYCDVILTTVPVGHWQKQEKKSWWKDLLPFGGM